MKEKPFFIITIDTEGDNLWQNSQSITTKNTHYLPRFQALCEKYGFKPVYLTNYEMASDPAYIEFARDVILRGQGEIGMHLHAWNNPPLVALSSDDMSHKPYLIEYPLDIIRAKVDCITKLLEDNFQTKMCSHRAGRWAFNGHYASLLLEYGYQVDCSVTPGVDWSKAKGNPLGQGGTDYRDFPHYAYFMDIEQINKAGNSSLLEVPMSTCLKYPGWFNQIRHAYNSLRGKPKAPSVCWLRPRGGNAAEMLTVAKKYLAQGSDYVEFMLHSSEFMPGGSPTFKTKQDIEQLYRDLEDIFAWLAPRMQGVTLAEYYQYKVNH
ncbi:MAG: polysaccharide deacetylase family protein [Plesiomonas sp.]|uniref:polysaccharide deacetylase family protein n=1 Tax=Plesiomonas sp. TaxID=2486279 RepID=UPI003F33AC0B